MRIRAAVLAGPALAIPTVAASPLATGPAAAQINPSARGLGAAAKPAREVVATGEGSGTGNLRVKAKVKGEPRYANTITILQRKDCRACTWRPNRQRRTGDAAFVIYPVSAPASGKRFFRVKVPATERFRASFSNVLVATRS